MPKCPNTFILCTTDAHKKYYSIKIGSFSFFSSSGKHQSHHLNGFCVTFFKFTMPRQKSDMNDSSRVIFIIISIIKVNNIIKIYTKNTHFITRKYDITRAFIKIEYIIICVAGKSFLIILLVTNQSGINFSASGQSSIA